jgi:cytochrome P450
MTIALEAFGNGLFFSEGEDWKTKRKLYSRVFHFDIIKYQ